MCLRLLPPLRGENEREQGRMTNKEIAKWLQSLKSEIGKQSNQHLWNYEEAIGMAIEALSVNSKAVVCRECVEYKCPNGMDMICALWNVEVFPDSSCEWGERREDSEA